MLQQAFFNTLSTHDTPKETQEYLWTEIVNAHSDDNRHYHTLKHLEYILEVLLPVKLVCHNWDAIILATSYHDLIYNILRKDNEEKSAHRAKDRLSNLNLPKATVTECYNHVIATKAHSISNNSDCNLFTDADLAILGSDWAQYKEYTDQVRKEYWLYPDLVYKPGRKKVLTHFLAMDSIFKSPYFFEKFEIQARDNLQKEVEILN